MALIEPRVLKGFRDSLPDAELARQAMAATLSRTLESFGFLPIDTPVLEYAEILLGKGGGETDKQVYRFLDHGRRDVAMRYDLTVPFARFVSEHRHELYLPFKRYHIAKVWRGENTQRGRYREFFQCDFDTVGVDSTSADLEILLVMAAGLRALGVERFRIHVAHRGALTALLERLGLSARSVEILRTIDKMAKVGRDTVAEQLRQLAPPDAVEKLLSFVTPAQDFERTLAAMAEAVGADNHAVVRLESIRAALAELGALGDCFLDPSITRGLDYYTGIVFETFLTDLPRIGSVCSGGRYDDLASLFSNERMPGVGASIGLDRLQAALSELGAVQGAAATVHALVLCLDESLEAHYHALAAAVRREGLSAEVYPDKAKLTRQFQLAEKKAIPYAIICGGDEKKRGVVSIKDLKTRESVDDVREAAVAQELKRLLARR
jgi:histidyl-tRNA synthetase